jgi:hypothetical protein
MESTNLMVINGNELPFEPGETILDVARRGHIDVPTLCHLERNDTNRCLPDLRGRGERGPDPAAGLFHAGGTQHGRAYRIAGGGGFTKRDSAPDAFFRQSQLRRARTDDRTGPNFNWASKRMTAAMRTVPGLGRLPASGPGLPLPGIRRGVPGDPIARIRWRRSTRLSCGIFPAVFFGPVCSGLQRGAGQQCHQLRVTGVRKPRSSLPATGP